MRTFYKLFLALILSPTFLLADGLLPSPPVTEADLTAAMRDAEKEYEAAIKTPVRPRLASSKASDDTASLMAELTKGVKSDHGSLLEELAAEVDTLKNKIVIERTTLLATQSPRKVKVQGARTVFNYRDDAVYEVTGAVDHIIDIQLKPGESLTTPPTSGDTVRWSIAVMKSGDGYSEVTHVVVKPLDEDIETNLLITTDRHVYQIKLKSGNFHMPAVMWTYEEDNQAKILDGLKREEASERTIRPEELRFTYEIDGDDYSWSPVRVFDDGSKTFIQMPQDLRVTEAPALFLLEDGSEPMLVNYRVKGDYYIVDRLFEKAELRVGPKKRVTIELEGKKNFFERLFS